MTAECHYWTQTHWSISEPIIFKNSAMPCYKDFSSYMFIGTGSTWFCTLPVRTATRRSWWGIAAHDWLSNCSVISLWVAEQHWLQIQWVKFVLCCQAQMFLISTWNCFVGFLRFSVCGCGDSAAHEGLFIQRYRLLQQDV